MQALNMIEYDMLIGKGFNFMGHRVQVPKK